MSKKELWIQNTGSSDISVSDLGVKVGAGKTINVFSYNPYLTEGQVKRSYKSGALKTKLDSGKLRQVKGKPSDKEKTYNLEESKLPFNISKQNKTSVVVEAPEDGFFEQDTDFNELADHELGGLEKDFFVDSAEGNAVVVKQKETEEAETEKGEELSFEKISGEGGRASAVVAQTRVNYPPKEEVLTTPIVKEAAEKEEEVKEEVKEEPKEATEKEEEVKEVEPEVKEEPKIEMKENSGMRVASKSKAFIMTPK